MPTLTNANEAHLARLTATERFCKTIAEGTGAPLTLVAIIILQGIWVVVGQITHRDPFPFIFLLTVSNIIQLILIVVLAVAGKQQSQFAEIRAETDHETIDWLLHHQQTQEAMLLALLRNAGIDTTGFEAATAELAKDGQ